ncbi:CLUMA_CG018352, isoform A [Clunio marinus]|uniref:CLUMA_CG018352, isoform A n=1 Tax=Clunio marinus TaxID=568069 RepID=A0A1J1IZF7_9DIPT|nr:CLUMA_CG018352, isoform A [Clunio marinus]
MSLGFPTGAIETFPNSGTFKHLNIEGIRESRMNFLLRNKSFDISSDQSEGFSTHNDEFSPKAVVLKFIEINQSRKAVKKNIDLISKTCISKKGKKRLKN